MNTQQFTVTAGSQTYRYVGNYTYLLIRACSVPVQVSPDGNVWQTVTTNDKINLPQAAERFYIRSLNGNAASVTVIFSTSQISINTQQGQPATYTKGTNLTGATALAANGSVTFSGLDGSQQRKHISVQNCDNGGNPVEVQDGAGVPLALVYANQPPWIYETSGIVIVKNPSGVAGLSRVIVGEAFYA